jgi:4-amino-4-deoxy-L-arabinose transferase-like glycosyltransferase
MDYPLLIPLSVAGGWNTLGSEVLRVPATLSMLFLFGMAGIIYCVITYLRSSSQAAIAVILLLGTPGLLLFSTFQTADIPLTYFFLASASLFVLASHENNRNLLFLSGMMAGLSAWTKNEGIPFVMLMVICTILVFGIRQIRANLFFLLAGMALPLFTIVLFKTVISVNNDLFSNNGLSEIISKLLSPTRYIQISTHLISELIHLGNWPISIIAILLVYGWIMGIRNPGNLTEKVLWVIPLSQFAIYMLIYVITPHDLEWHLNYSMSRLLIHLFPLVLFSFFLFVNTPETVLNK